MLAHAEVCMSGEAQPSMLARALHFTEAFPRVQGALVGAGGLTAAQEAELCQVLQDKGVSADAVQERVQAAVKKLGSGCLAVALQSKNV